MHGVCSIAIGIAHFRSCQHKQKSTNHHDFCSVIMFVGRVSFLVLVWAFLCVLPFPTQNCDQPVPPRVHQTFWLDFNFVMVEEAKQYLCDPQISAWHWKSLVISCARFGTGDSVPWGIASTLRERNNESSQRRSSTLLGSLYLVVVLLDVHDSLMDEGEIRWNYYYFQLVVEVQASFHSNASLLMSPACCML